MHPVFCMTALVTDEDGNKKLKAWPKCVISSGPKPNIENGADEVAEVEFEIAVSPDDDGFGVYEAIESDLKDETVKTTWLESFTPDMVKLTA